MFFTPFSLIGYGGYLANSTRFSATQYMARGAAFTGAADSSSLLMSFWVNMKGADGSTFRFMGNSGVYGNGFNITRNTSNKFVMQLSTPGGANALLITSAATFQTTSGWKHILINYNNASPQFYISDSSDAFTDGGSSFGTAAFTQADTWIGGISASAALDAEIADFYWAPGQTLDLSVTANRRKFITAGLKPVSLGADGSAPTGTAPIAFFSNPYTSFQTNLGSGGGMTLTGTLAAGATSPSS